MTTGAFVFLRHCPLSKDYPSPPVRRTPLELTLPPVALLWVIAILSTITVIHRMRYNMDQNAGRCARCG